MSFINLREKGEIHPPPKGRGLLSIKLKIEWDKEFLKYY